MATTHTSSLFTPDDTPVLAADRDDVGRAARPGASGSERHLIVLDGGPRAGWCYWLTDWTRHLDSVRAQRFPPDHPASAALHYQPTGHHANHRHGQGEVWRYTPPAPPSTVATSARRDAGGAVICPRCQRIAPNLITWWPAGRSEPIVECPRCAYPTHDAMPGVYQDWYAARILITGSRTWQDTVLLTTALAHVRQRWPGATLVHGDADGADRMAAALWRSWGLATEAHPADWTASCPSDCPPGHRRQRRHDGRWYCPRAGRRRNAAMVAAGANACVAFIRHHSRGASHCAELAERAGIPTWRPRAATAPPD